MSNETILPPSIPEDASKSSLPPTPNIRQNGAAKILHTSITAVQYEYIKISEPLYPFLSFARGVIARACKASINLTGTEVPGVYSKFLYGLAPTWDGCQLMLAQYFFYIYKKIIDGETSLPYHPRNIGFCLMALARNRVASVEGQVTLYIYGDTITPTITEEQIQKVATLFGHQALSYDLVNVPVYESGPFPASKDDQAKSPVTECKMAIDQIGSTMTTYTNIGFDTAFQYQQYYAEDVQVGSWWIKAALATKTSAPAQSSVTATWSNISIPGEVLAAWVAYADTVCDVPYVFVCVPLFDQNVLRPTSTDPNPVSPYFDMLSTWRQMYEDNGETFRGDIFKDLALTSHTMYQVCQFATSMYSPFGQLAISLFYPPTIVPDQGGSSPFERLLFTASWRVPIYLPSLFSEVISSVAEQTIIKSTQEGFTHSTQIFNLPSWPMYFDTKGSNYVPISQMVLNINTWEEILIHRKFLKLNLNPEYKVNKAVMPYFFLHVPVNKQITIGGVIQNEDFDALISPYSPRYIEDHNLHILCRCMPWPRVFSISQSMVSWMPIIDMKPLSGDGFSWNTLEPTFDWKMFAMLSVDMSFMADGCDMDAYLNKLRTSHLGFFAALAGLLPTALKIGTALFKTITKPEQIDSVDNSTNRRSDIDKSQTNNMAMAGISSLSQTINGLPGSGGTVDLSSTVNVDPVNQVLEAGKRYNKTKKIMQAVTFGGKALKFGRTFYHNYENQQ